MQGRPPAPTMLHRKIPYMTWPDTSRKPGFTAGAGHAPERRVRGRMATGRGAFMNGAEGPPDRDSGGLGALPRAAVSTGAECVLSKVSGRAGKDIVHRRIRSPCAPFEGSVAETRSVSAADDAGGLSARLQAPAARTGRNPQATAKGRGKHVRAAVHARPECLGQVPRRSRGDGVTGAVCATGERRAWSAVWPALSARWRVSGPSTTARRHRPGSAAGIPATARASARSSGAPGWPN